MEAEEIRDKIDIIDDKITDVVMELEAASDLSIFYADHVPMNTEVDKIESFHRLEHLCRRAVERLHETRIDIQKLTCQ